MATAYCARVAPVKVNYYWVDNMSLGTRHVCSNADFLTGLVLIANRRLPFWGAGGDEDSAGHLPATRSLASHGGFRIIKRTLWVRSRKPRFPFFHPRQLGAFFHPFHPEGLRLPKKGAQGQVCILQARGTPQCLIPCDFSYTSPPLSLLRAVCLPAATPYPVAAGSAAIRRTTLPNRLRIR